MRKLTRSYGFSIALLCILISGCGKPDYQTVDGTSGRFADLQGRWMLINYWAAWCEPCIKEIPELNRFNQQYAKQAAVFTVNFDGVKGAELQQQAAKLKFAVPVLLDDPAMLLGYKRPEALPSTFVFGPDGKLKKVLQGEQTVASLAAAIGIDPAAPTIKP
jgi:thiol-disulfide isomerase/thioredoxin